MSQLIDQQTVRRNPAVDPHLLDRFRQQLAEIDRLGAHDSSGYSLVAPLDTSGPRRLDNPKPPEVLSNQALGVPPAPQ